MAPLSASPPLLIKKISPIARTPTRGSTFAAGYDLYASEAAKIPARGRGLVGTGLQMAISEGCCKFGASQRKLLCGVWVRLAGRS